MKTILLIIIVLIIGFIAGIGSSYKYISNISNQQIESIMNATFSGLTEKIQQTPLLSGGNITQNSQQLIQQYKQSIENTIQEYKKKEMDKAKEEFRLYLQNKITTLFK